MTTSKVSLLDTNVLVYAADTTSPFYLTAKSLIDRGVKGKEPLCVCPQVLKEFFAVLTDSKRVSTPRNSKEAMVEVEKYVQARNILKIYPQENILENMIALSKRYEIKRQEVFDLQLVAIMLSNNISRIYTYDQGHFSKFKELEVLTPPSSNMI
jgi:predicted nucleic acid-binding protein